MHSPHPHFPNKAEWLTRPARKQVDDATLQKEIQARGGYGERNLWSGRRVGPSGHPGCDGKRGGPGAQRVKDASKYRCVLELDVGRTRGSDAKQHVFCLYFAKGCCSQGSACTYLHRLPTADDEAYTVKDLSADIFGREKRAESEGFRKGAGTLERDNRTLYVNYEGAGGYDLPKIRQLLDANFRAFGPVNNIYIVHPKNIAFVRYDWRSSAEFAKEAIHKQGLVGSKLGEVITARWANEDPNPVAVLAQKRACEEAFGVAVMSSFEALPPEQKQARIMELQLQGALRRGAAIGAYPATDEQFEERERQVAAQRELEARRQAEEAAAAGGQVEEEEEEDIPYIPEDIYEQQQRLAAQQQQPQQQGSESAGAPQSAAAYGMGPLVGDLSQGQQLEQDARGDPGSEEGGAGPGPGSMDAAAAAAAAAAAGSELSEWERAWHDPELRERMHSDPEMREKMRRARNESVYWSAYQAHYTAYATSYGHEGWDAQQQSMVAGQGQGQGVDYQTAEAWYAQYGGWYGQQTGFEANAEQGGPGMTREVGRVDRGYGAGGEHGGQAVGGEAASGTVTDAKDAQQSHGGKDGKGDGLSLLGAAYGSDEDDEDT